MIALGRRAFLAGAAAFASAGRLDSATGGGQMFGLIGRMRAVQGQRETLISILLEATSEMPGCLSYVVARDTADDDALWITEVWDSRASHRASLELPHVQAAIGRARPIIAGIDSSTETEPVGGLGLPSGSNAPAVHGIGRRGPF